MTTPTPDYDAMAIDLVGIFDGHPLDAHDKIVAILTKHLAQPTEPINHNEIDSKLIDATPTEPPAPKTAMERLPEELRKSITVTANALVHHGADRHYAKEHAEALAQKILPYIERIEELEAVVDTVTDILAGAPELNPSNYDHEQACELNAKVVEVCLYMEKAALAAKANQEGGAA